MLGLALVRPLEDDWRDTIDGLLARFGWPTTRNVSALGARVADLSRAYNDATHARATMTEAGAARLGFAFARDVPKGAGAVRELVATRKLQLQRPVRVLDVGAGLGAMTWGLARALEASGATGDIEATWTDVDRRALDVGEAIVKARVQSGKVGLRVRTVVDTVDAQVDGRFDVVFLGNVLSELDVGGDPGERVACHARMLHEWLDQRVDVNGSLVIVEPALRDRTRHLHRVRDELASLGATVFAPCVRAEPCPALARETDWCHEDLPIDVPPWLVPVARAAGLRHQGLTWSYLVLRKDGARVADALPAPAGAARLRVVSDARPSKGKLEAFVCGDVQWLGELKQTRTLLTRLNRDERAHNSAWNELARGDLFVVDPAPSADPTRSARIASETLVHVARDASKSH